MPEGPLLGVTALVTRAREQSGVLCDPLAALGAEVILTPAIRFEEPEDWAPADAALKRAGSYDWAIFTSANGVAAVARRLEILSLDWSAFRGVRLVAIGPATEEALLGFGLAVDVVPEVYQAEGILDSLSKEPVAGRRVLLARAFKAREVLPEALRRQGAVVDVAAVYHTKPCPASEDAIAALTDRPGPGVVATFTSSSTVAGFLDRLPAPALAGLGKCVLAAIGPITAEDLRRRGLAPRIIPSRFTIPALVRAIREHFTR